MSAKVWINGEIVTDPRISVFDHGLTVGDGVFETVKTVDGVPFALTRHLHRLEHSANGMLIQPPSHQEIRAGIAALVPPESGLGRLRITVTAGPGGSGSARDPRAHPTVMITHVAAKAWPAEAAVMTLPWPRNERSPLSGLKTTSYAENVLGLARAQQAGADEALFPNTEGDLCEGTGSNVFLRFNGGTRWYTPPLSSGALAGITRALVLEWCEGVEEREIAMQELDQVEAMILTSSTRDVQAVGSLNHRRLAGASDEGTRLLQKTFTEMATNTLDP